VLTKNSKKESVQISALRNVSRNFSVLENFR